MSHVVHNNIRYIYLFLFWLTGADPGFLKGGHGNGELTWRLPRLITMSSIFFFVYKKRDVCPHALPPDPPKVKAWKYTTTG